MRKIRIEPVKGRARHQPGPYANKPTQVHRFYKICLAVVSEVEPRERHLLCTKVSKSRSHLKRLFLRQGSVEGSQTSDMVQQASKRFALIKCVNSLS